jgi:16S rRNA (guanine527-N7)-methyltransferase
VARHAASPQRDARLLAVLGESRRRGYLGPAPLEPQIAHARSLARSVERAPSSFLDLGAGGGLPGLVLAVEWPYSSAVLLDSSTRRTEFLREALDALGLVDRVDVVCARAEAAARHADLRERFPLVVARSFGPPAVTAECAVGFLQPGGRLVVSEPRDAARGRWPADALAELGFEAVEIVRGEHAFAALRRSAALDQRWPRRDGIPAKRPLW